MTAVDGVLVLHLHAHLPDVRRAGDWAEDWYFSAVFDSYLPLIEIAEGWLRDGVPARVGLSLSPPLVAMLEDVDLNRRASERFRATARLARGARPPGADEDAWRFFTETVERRADRFERAPSGHLGGAFGRLETAGVLELSTSGATHGFFPFLSAIGPELVDAQIRVGRRRHQRCLGRPPPGFWLPECGYVPGLDAHLTRAGVSYFFVDAHAARFAALQTGAPLSTPAGTVAFARDVECALRVWSPDSGYPTDPRYREFHRDLGRELPASVLEAAGLPTDGRPLGIKLHRITDRALDGPRKAPYDPSEGQRAAEEHADHFVEVLTGRAAMFRGGTGRAAVLVAPYDAELFGHWWFEGPLFLDRLARRLSAHPRLRLWSASDVIRTLPALEIREPEATSWGRGGYASTWLTPQNHWVQDKVADVSTRMVRAVRSYPHPSPAEARVLDAMARQTLELSASDWPFLITAGTFADYAARRVEDHASRFAELESVLRTDPERVLDVDLAPDVSYRDFGRDAP